jgi:hypothetical protein
MASELPSPELSLATLGDVARELDARGLEWALAASHTFGKPGEPAGDLRCEERERVYASRFQDQHPAYKAAFLFRGIQRCLDDALRRDGGACSLVAELSTQAKALLNRLRELMPERP